MRVGKSSLDFNCLLCMDFKILLCMDFKILLCMDFKILLCLDFKSFFAWILASLFRLKKWLAKKVFLAWISSFAWVSKVPLLDPLWIPFGFPLDSIWIPFGSLIGVQMKVGKQFFFLEQNKLVCWIPFGSPLDL